MPNGKPPKTTGEHLVSLYGYVQGFKRQIELFIGLLVVHLPQYLHSSVYLTFLFTKKSKPIILFGSCILLGSV